MPSSIRIDDLTVSYGGAIVLKGVTMTIPTGEVMAIIGPSGCGKTSLLRRLNRLSKVTPRSWIQGTI